MDFVDYSVHLSPRYVPFGGLKGFPLNLDLYPVEANVFNGLDYPWVWVIEHVGLNPVAKFGSFN